MEKKRKNGVSVGNVKVCVCVYSHVYTVSMDRIGIRVGGLDFGCVHETK